MLDTKERTMTAGVRFQKMLDSANKNSDKKICIITTLGDGETAVCAMDTADVDGDWIVGREIQGATVYDHAINMKYIISISCS